MSPTLKPALLASAAVLLLSASVSLASYTDWDANSDGGIDSTEYGASLDGLGAFDSLDVNKDSYLTSQEVETGLDRQYDVFNQRYGNDYQTRWDTNSDNRLSRDEFNAGTYSSYDRNQDGLIDQQEYSDLDLDTGSGGILGS